MQAFSNLALLLDNPLDFLALFLQTHSSLTAFLQEGLHLRFFTGSCGLELALLQRESLSLFLDALVLRLALLGQDSDLLADLEQMRLYFLNSVVLRNAGALGLIELLLARLYV